MGNDSDDGQPSQLYAAFVEYLRAGPLADDGSAGLEGVRRAKTELGGIPAVALEPLAGRPDRTVLYFHGGGYVSGSQTVVERARETGLRSESVVHHARSLQDRWDRIINARATLQGLAVVALCLSLMS